MKYILPYLPNWKQRFSSIAQWLEPHLPEGCQIHHIGSTSIPGMPAKDIIDLDLECPIGLTSQVIACLEPLGYFHEGNKGIPGREALAPKLGTEAQQQPVHHLYVCESGAHELKKHLAYRDYLIQHPERAQWLAEQKRAVDASAESRAQYIKDKAPFYEIITLEALAWAKIKFKE